MGMSADRYARVVQIRRAVSEDAAQIANIHLQAWHGEYQGQPQAVLDSLDPTQRLPHWPTILSHAEWPRRGTLAAEDAHALVGFSNLCPTRDEDNDQATVGEITSLYVLPDTWGKGIGRRLMAASLATLTEAGYAHATLWVLDTNVRAIRFYETTGWHAEGATKHDSLSNAPIRNLRYQHDLA